MNTLEKLLCVVSASILLVGIQISIRWTYNSKITGAILILISLLILYLIYIKNRKSEFYASKINIKHIGLGLLLILGDISYNLYADNAFRDLDYGILSSGAIIILLNIGIFSFLKLGDRAIYFSTYFIFISASLYGFLFKGIQLIFNTSKNPFLDYITNVSLAISAFLLDFIKPTSIIGNVLNFDEFRIGIANACSGVESITIYLSAVIAYFISIKEKNIKKFFKYSIIGITALFFMNVLRIMILMIVGYSYGTEKMLFVHYNLGWIFFAIGIAVFWYMVIDDF